MSMRWLVGLLLSASILAGAFLRLSWSEDIEHKRDEEWTVHVTRHWHAYDHPWVGMASSQRARNPGMSIWIFVALGRTFDATDAVSLARIVQISNVLAILLLLWFALRWIPKSQREPWLWAIPLTCVNPLAVVFHRRIWPPSILPFFAMLFLMAWWKRHTRSGAFFWGLLGALLGQIHLAFFFYAFAFVLGTWTFSERRPQWKFWFTGSLLGALPLIPWMGYVLSAPDRPLEGVLGLHRLVEFKFWMHWTTEPMGLGLKHVLDTRFDDFLRGPMIDGRPTFLVWALHLMVIALGGGMVVWELVQRVKQGKMQSERKPTSKLALQIAFWGYGIVLTLTMLRFYRHYLVITFPFLYVWLASVFCGSCRISAREKNVRRGLLALLCIAQFLITLQFLLYVHHHFHDHLGHYGVPWRGQQMQ